MKQIILFILGALLSINVFAAQYEVSGEDFDLFPLSVKNVSFLEGSWIGKSIVIEISSMNVSDKDKPYLWVQITDKKDPAKYTKFGVIYFNQSHETYELYMFGLQKSLPMKIGIFEYTKFFANEKEMSCKSGGSVMQLEFELAGMETSKVQLQRELCVRLKDFRP